MASFIISGYSTAAQTLASSDTGIVTRTGTLAVSVAAPITASGNPKLEIEGAVFSRSLLYPAIDADGTSAQIRVGETGTVTAFAAYGIDVSVTNYFYMFNEGSLRGTDYALRVVNGDGGARIDLFNSGKIQSGSSAVHALPGPEELSIVNTGEILSDSFQGIYTVASDVAALNNSGVIRGRESYVNAANASGRDEIFNSGLMAGGIRVTAGNDRITNRGDITLGKDAPYAASILMGDGEDLLTNAGGFIEGDVWMDDGNDRVVNSGHISGGVYLDGNDPNIGQIATLNSLWNSGLIGGIVRGGVQFDYVVNTGRIEIGVNLDRGDDFFNGAGGTVGGLIFGERGSDTILGGDGNDSISGGTEGDALSGRGGADSILGDDGLDTLIGGAGDDTLDGGAGNDVMTGGDDDDVMIGRGSNDTMNGNDGDDDIQGNDGSDILNGGNGDDSLNGGNGNDTIYGGADDDTLGGGEGADVMFGGNGDDQMLGWIANDMLYGNAGRDMLNGQSGLDTLNGGWGDDTLTGGSEADVFVFIFDNGTDIITDFENNIDLIDLRDFHTTFGALQSGISEFNGGALINLAQVGGTGSVWVQGTPSAYLNANDFIF